MVVSSIATVIIASIFATAILPLGASAQQQNETTTMLSTMKKPVDGYDSPEGHHCSKALFSDPSLAVHHYCKPSERIVATCQLYDGSSDNATLIGVEYVITHEQYNMLPEKENPYWHHHAEEFLPSHGNPMITFYVYIQCR